MTLNRDRPEILTPPSHPPACCTAADDHHPARRRGQDPPETRLPLAAHRRSYARRTGADADFATTKDPASNNITRGWCRLMGADPAVLFCRRPANRPQPADPAAWNARQDDNARRAAAGLNVPKTSRRRRKTLAALTTAARPPSHRAATQREPAITTTIPEPDAGCAKPAPATKQTTRTRTAPEHSTPGTRHTAARLPDRNVKIILTET